MESTLLLNATFEPLDILPWQRAMTLFYQGKVEIIDEHAREVRAVTFSFKLPSIVRLLRFVKVRRAMDYVPFTRGNIYARDGYRCQYCGDEFPTQELTFDHVVPAAQGGRKTWENIVTACVTCNRTKDARTPAEAGMMLKRAPRKPRSAPTLRLTVGVRHAPASWRDYLYWNIELDDGP
jgi:5-methylcytosine-specific restriction endonuclease McrA